MNFETCIMSCFFALLIGYGFFVTYFYLELRDENKALRKQLGTTFEDVVTRGGEEKD